MNPRLLLRIASLLTLAFCAAHMAGMPWTPVTGPGERAVMQAMQSDHFAVMGFDRTFRDFYVGFGVIIGAYLLLQGIVLWQLAAVSATQPAGVRPIIATFCLSFAANAIIDWKFFFPAALIMAAAVAVSLAVSWISLRVPQSAPQRVASPQ